MSSRPSASRRAVIGLGVTLCAVSLNCRSAPISHPARSEIGDVAREPALGTEAAAPDRGLTRAPTPGEQRTIEALMRAAEHVRGLRFVREVPVRIQDRIAIMAFAESQIEADELRRASVIYTALGLLPRDIDLRALLVRLLGEQIVGYYDEEASRLVVRDEVMRAFEQTEQSAIDLTEARLTIVHELVHALQDQQLGLSQKLDQDRDADASNAFKALYEGDAMLAMSVFAHAEAAEFAQPQATPSSSPSSARGALPAASELQRAPAIVRVPLLFAYLDGLTFAAHLFAQGGFERIDQAYADPPLSTEQVLHPERSARERQPDHPRWSAPEAALGPDHELLYEDTLGELEMSVYFGAAYAAAGGRHSAAGWGGDRLYVYRSVAAELVAVWLTSWDSERDAIDAAAAAERVRARAGALAASQLVRRLGRSVLIVRNADAALQSRLLARFTVWAQH